MVDRNKFYEIVDKINVDIDDIHLWTIKGLQSSENKLLVTRTGDYKWRETCY